MVDLVGKMGKGGRFVEVGMRRKWCRVSLLVAILKAASFIPTLMLVMMIMMRKVLKMMIMMRRRMMMMMMMMKKRRMT